MNDFNTNFIENASRFDVATGFHSDPGPNAMLIQISDLLSEHPKPKLPFKEVHGFRFEDIEEDEEWAITQDQANEIGALLKRAKEHNMNVIVHCHAGLCRSGAVVECGIFIGFNPPDRLRMPNTLVKKKIMRGWGHEINEKTSVFAETHFEEFYDRRYD